MLIDIHGLVIRCDAPSPELTAAVLRPFKYFIAAAGTPSVVVRIDPVEPPYATFPSMSSRFSTPRNVVYEEGSLKVIDYFGKGAVVQDRDRRVYAIYGADENLLQEAFYLLVLSLLGQHCDRVGLLRVHALAVSSGDCAFLLMMPPGAGKSTLALALMREGHVGYISDDDPLFDPRGRILPFPRALGILERERIRDIPDEFIYSVDRMEFGTKYYVDADFWPDRVERRPLDRIVLIKGRRVLNGVPAISPVSGMRILKTLMRDAVLGIGLYQGLEFLVNRSSIELLAKVPILWRRLRLAIRLSRAAQCYELVLTRDHAATQQVVTDFIERFR